MDKRIVDFLKKYIVSKGQQFSHTSKISPLRSYNIPDEDLENFWQIYQEVVAEGGIVGITEKPLEIVPLIVDVDFKCPMEDGLKRYYKPKHIRELIQIYQEIISELVVNPNDENIYTCCVLEKINPTVIGGKIKDGFHLHFPFFWTEGWIQKEYIRIQVIQRVTEKKIFSDIPFCETLDKVFDRNIPSVCWLMYGSRKEPKLEPYRITKCYNKELDTLKPMHVFKKKYSNGNKAFNYPRYLSIRDKTMIATQLKPGLTKKSIKNKPKIVRTRTLEQILSDLIISDQLMGMLNDSRANDYNDWMTVGWILFNIAEGHEKGLEQWIAFSKKNDEKFKEGECEKLWEKMERKNYSLASLKYIASQDAPNEYKIWKNSQINNFLHQYISDAHNDIARVLYLMFENKYICADVDKEIWYEFRGHRWCKIAKGIGLRREFKVLIDKYSEIMIYYITKSKEEQTEDGKFVYNAKCQKITKLIEKLKNHTFKNAVIKECMEYFHDEKFIERMDEQKHLLVYENGVYDCSICKFRDGRPDDYCTKTTGLYYQEFEEDDPLVLELESIFKKIFPNDKVYKFFKQTTGELIRGGNRHKIFIIWNGGGNNGKSVVADLLEKALGDYYYTPPTSLLTGKSSQSSSATAELIPLKGARIVCASETGNDDFMNCEIMKKLTGGDPIYARGLFKDPITIHPQFILVLHCNKLPKVSAEDKASWERIRVLPFNSKFVKKDKAPDSIEEQWKQRVFVQDRSLKERLPQLAEVFSWWLIKQYNTFKDSELYEPLEVKASTKDYHKINDFYLQFIEDRITITKDYSDVLSLETIYSIFKVWYKECYPGNKTANRDQVKQSLEKKFIDSGLSGISNGVWRGIKFSESNNDIPDNEQKPKLASKQKKSSKLVSQSNKKWKPNSESQSTKKSSKLESHSNNSESKSTKKSSKLDSQSNKKASKSQSKSTKKSSKLDSQSNKKASKSQSKSTKKSSKLDSQSNKKASKSQSKSTKKSSKLDSQSNKKASKSQSKSTKKSSKLDSQSNKKASKSNSKLNKYISSDKIITIKSKINNDDLKKEFLIN